MVSEVLVSAARKWAGISSGPFQRMCVVWIVLGRDFTEVHLKICPSTWVSILLNQERGAGVFHKDMADAVVDIAVINHPLNGGGAIVQAGTQATGIHLNFGIEPFFNFLGLHHLVSPWRKGFQLQALGAT